METLDPGRIYVIRAVGRAPSGLRWAAQTITGHALTDAAAVWTILGRMVERIGARLESEGVDPRTMEWTGGPWHH